MSSTPPIDITGLSVEFPGPKGAVRAVRDLTLRVNPGQVFGFLGPNGAGKTTTIHVLLGYTRPTAGSARLFGMDVGAAIARERIGYLSENPDTYRFLTGRELLAFTARLFGMRGDALRTRTGALLEEMSLTAAADRRVATYSRGMRQRLCLAQALVNDPDLLILDEPTGGLDPLGRADVRRIIQRLRERGKTVFFSSHELSEVEMICDHVAIMAQGRLAVAGPAASLVPAGESLESYFLKVISCEA